MNTGQKRYLFLLGPFLILFVAVACSGPKAPATPAAPAPGAEQALETASYKIRLLIGPAVTQPTLDQFEGVTEGELMGLMSRMAMMDQGQTVNRHLKVHIQDKRSGAAVTNPTPTVGIVALTGGASRGLPNVTACLSVRHKVFPHFGDNLYLPPGKYSVTVAVGNESASFEVSP